MKRTTVAGAIIVNSKLQTVLVHQQGKSWSFPKGHVEKEESLETTLKREIFEETGIKEFTTLTFLGKYSRFALDSNGLEDITEHKEIYLWLVFADKKKLHPQDDEASESVWVGLNQAIEMLTHQKDREFLKKNLETILRHKGELENATHVI